MPHRSIGRGVMGRLYHALRVVRELLKLLRLMFLPQRKTK
jgi:hypothetical protein